MVSQLKASASQRVIFFRSLTALFSAGVPIDRCFGILGDQFDDESWRSLCRVVAAGLMAGHPLHQLLRQRPDCMGEFHLTMIRLGLQTGRLAAVLERLAEAEEKGLKLRQRVVSSLTYPAITFVICLLAVLCLPPLVLGGILDMLAGSGEPLPWMTRALVALSNLLRWPPAWLVMILLPLAAAYGLRRFVEPDVRRRALESALLGWAYSRDLYRSYITLRAAEGLMVCLECGLPVLQSMALAASVSGSLKVQDKMEESREALKDGACFSEAIALVDLFDPLLVMALEVGEESGTLVVSLRSTVRLLEEGLETRLVIFTSLLEPLVMAVLGVVVGAMVIATLLPMARFLESL